MSHSKYIPSGAVLVGMFVSCVICLTGYDKPEDYTCTDSDNGENIGTLGLKLARLPAENQLNGTMVISTRTETEVVIIFRIAP